MYISMKNLPGIGYIRDLLSVTRNLSFDEMWKFIDELTRPNELVHERKILTYDDVFAIYSKLVEYDQVFRELLQIRLLQKETEKI